MIYLSLNELAIAAAETDIENVDELKRLGKLMQVYFAAMESAPADVIGVGFITWAEDNLIAYQLCEVVQ
jgi:hypothetical protein